MERVPEIYKLLNEALIFNFMPSRNPKFALEKTKTRATSPVRVFGLHFTMPTKSCSRFDHTKNYPFISIYKTYRFCKVDFLSWITWFCNAISVSENLVGKLRGRQAVGQLFLGGNNYSIVRSCKIFYLLHMFLLCCSLCKCFLRGSLRLMVFGKRRSFTVLSYRSLALSCLINVGTVCKTTL